MKKRRTDCDTYHPLVKETKPRFGTHSVAVVNVIHDANLVVMESGMRKICEYYGIKIEELPAGNAVLFVSRDRRYIKCLVANTEDMADYPIVCSQRLPSSKIIPTSVYAGIAKAFKMPGEISYQKRLTNALKEFYEKPIVKSKGNSRPGSKRGPSDKAAANSQSQGPAPKTN